MSKGSYSAVDFQGWMANEGWSTFEGSDELIIGVDVAKVAFYGAVTTAQSDACDIIYFERDQIRSVVKAVAGLEFDSVTLVVEPTGTYGDSLIDQARAAGFDVVRISGEQVAGAKTVFDGVPSLHDGKAAHVLSHLYLHGVGQPWEHVEEGRRDLRALADLDELIEKTRQMYVGRLEAHLARHWPEVTDSLKLTSATLLELVAAFGSPQAVAAEPDQAEALMRRVGGGFLADDKIEAVIASAATTQGVEPTGGQRHHLEFLAGMLRENQRRAAKVERQSRQAAEQHRDTRALVDFAGRRTALVLVAYLGALTDYDSPAQLEKAMGMNLCEHTTGRTRQSKQTRSETLHISKRGPGRPRNMLYWLALRVINPIASSYCPIATAWYQQRLRRNGGETAKALVALMRKLIRALWWIARGEEYDGTELFDVARLERKGYL